MSRIKRRHKLTDIYFTLYCFNFIVLIIFDCCCWFELIKWKNEFIKDGCTNLWEGLRKLLSGRRDLRWTVKCTVCIPQLSVKAENLQCYFYIFLPKLSESETTNKRDGLMLNFNDTQCLQYFFSANFQLIYSKVLFEWFSNW